MFDQCLGDRSGSKKLNTSTGGCTDWVCSVRDVFWNRKCHVSTVAAIVG